MASSKRNEKKEGLIKRIGKKLGNLMFNAEESSKVKKVTLQLLTSLLILASVASGIVFMLVKTPASEINTAYQNLAQESATYARISNEEEKATQKTKMDEAGQLYDAIMQRYESSDMVIYREYAKISVDESQVNSFYIYLVVPFVGLIVMLLTSGIQKFFARVNVTLAIAFLIVISPVILLVYMIKSTIVSLYNNRKNKPSKPKHIHVEVA